MSKLSSTELSSYERAQRNYWDLTNTFNSAERRGIKKGETKEALRIAQNMMAKHYPIEEISDITGLSIDEIKAISLN